MQCHETASADVTEPVAQALAPVFQRHRQNNFQLHIQISSRSGQTRNGRA